MTKINKDLVVWITGASSGIGEQITYQVNEKEAKIIISARRLEELERVKNNCKYPDNIKILPLDLAKTDELNKKAKEAKSYFDKIDVLFNNGGISQRDLAVNTKLEVDRRIMEINYFGTIALSKAVLPSMIERKSGHHVITSSAVGIISTPYRSSYAAAKHALHGFYDALRAELHQENVNITLCLPGFIRTDISKNALTGKGEALGTMDNAQANGMSAEDCAKKMIQAVEGNKEEVYIGGLKEVAGIYVKRFFPSIFSNIVRKMAVR